MKTTEFNYWIMSIGWTLLHSLWQGFVITLVYLFFRRLVPVSHAARRYQLSAMAISAVFVASIITFFIYTSGAHVEGPSPGAAAALPDGIDLPVTITMSMSLLQTASIWINEHALIIVAVWLIGVIIFSLRLGFAFWTSSRLRNEAVIITGYWQERMAEMANELGMSAAVVLAECASIASPIVLGLFKPIVLLPVGMQSGLTVDQIESILLHELAHIRRRDYLFNVVQSIMEVVFFFNPFVWMISSRMRIEREQCCDDIVVQFKNPMIYAKALHQLEAERIGVATMGLAAAGSKNQLLKRIKRIMETNRTKEKSSRRIIPALMIIGLLITGSWLSVQARRAKLTNELATDTVAADTVIERKHGKKKSTHQKNTVTTFDSNDEATPLTHSGKSKSDDAPASPNALTPLVLSFDMDTIPNINSNENLNGNYEQFNKAFTEQFKARFGDFYKQNAKEIDNMLNEATTQMESIQPDGRDHEELPELLELKKNEMLMLSSPLPEKIKEQKFTELKLQNSLTKLQLAELKREAANKQRESEMLMLSTPSEEKLTQNKFNEVKLQKSLTKLQLAELKRETADKQREVAESNYQEIHDQADKTRETLVLTEKIAAEEEAGLEGMMDTKNPFNKEISDELVKDHYLTPGERMNSLSWDNDHITINGKEISETDSPKYNRLLRSYKKNVKMKTKIKTVKPVKEKKKGKDKDRIGSAE